MAYYQKYQCNFNNRNTNNIRVEFWEKDVFSDTVEILPCVSLKTSYYEGQENKFLPTIIGLKLEVVIRAKDGSGSNVNAEMFYPQAADQWKVIAYSDSVCIFNGFIVNDVEPYQMKEKPYNIVVRATDGLMQLKSQPLTDVAGAKFNGRNTLLEYIVGALAKTKTQVNVRSYVNYYNVDHNDRGDLGSPDMLTQTQLHHRSLLKDVNSFYSCFEALERILKGWAILYQYEGEYCIVSRADVLKGSGTNYFFTEYDYQGNFLNATLETYGDIPIGKQQFLQPIELNQYASYDAPFKSVKTIYNYEIPENLVNNQRLQELGAIIAPLSGSGYSAYQKVGWGAYSGDPNGLTSYSGGKNTYIKTEFNAFGVETDRYYVIEADTGIATALGLQIRNDNADFWVDAGDKLTISVTSRLMADEGGSSPLLLGRVALLKDGASGSLAADWYSLNPGGDWVNNPFANFAQTNETGDNSQWVTYTTQADDFPSGGTLYIFLGSGGVDNLNEAHHKDLEITYTPYVKGSRLTVKGDYWLTSQNTVLNDVLEEEMYISDAPKRILKGALWDNAGTALTDPDWYRYGTAENRHFKELVNLTRYQHQFRPIRKISGAFKGVMWQTNLLIGTLTTHPICLHNRFYFENEPLSTTHYYIFCAPVEMDWVNARVQGTLVEVIRDNTEYSDVGDSHTFNYIF